jgi:hypothetical protein
MIEEFEYKGKWWLPNEPDEKISGTIRFSPSDGALLELMGRFGDIKNFFEGLDIEIVLGVSTDGKKITLYDCLETKKSIGSEASGTSSIFAHKIFVGAHFAKKEDIKFRSMSVRYSHLDDWVGISGFKIEESFKNREVTVEYKLPEPMVARISNDYNISIDFRGIYPAREIVQKEVTIRQKTYIKIESPLEKSWNEYVFVMAKVRNFLSLLIGQPTELLAIEGKTEANKEIIGGKTYYSPVEIFYYTGKSATKIRRKLIPQEMLFTLQHVSRRFEDVLKQWFDNAEFLEPVFNLYFGTLYNRDMYAEQRFLSLVMALESYHRKVINNRELPEEEHEKRIDTILSSASEGHKRWLSKKLEYSNEPNLRNRLKEILDDCRGSITFIKDKKSFVDKVVTTRNYNVHFDLNLKERAAKGLELYHLIEKLQVLVEISLLKKSGFTLEDIKESFSRYRRYQEVGKWK